MWKYFVLGMLVGWLLEWVVDWLFRRRPAATPGPARDTASPPDASAAAPRAVESNAGTSTSAGTSAGRVGSEAALGAEGAVSTSSATLTSTAPVYRQEDLEAIGGIDPRIGALLRAQGITTFSHLAVAPLDELARLVEGAGRALPRGGVAAWRAQARLAAAGDWAGLARAHTELPGVQTPPVTVAPEPLN